MIFYCSIAILKIFQVKYIYIYFTKNIFIIKYTLNVVQSVYLMFIDSEKKLYKNCRGLV